MRNSILSGIISIPFFCSLVYCLNNGTQARSNFHHVLEIIRKSADSIIDKSGVKSQCAVDLRCLVSDAIHRKQWALEMIDATGKLQSGILTGNIYQMGNFDQCIAVKETIQTNHTIEGQYCSVLLVPQTNISSQLSPFIYDIITLKHFKKFQQSAHLTRMMSLLRFGMGICIPRSCSIENLQSLWNYIMVTFNIHVDTIFIDELCNYEGKPLKSFPVDNYVYGALAAVLSITLLLTALRYISQTKNAYLNAFAIDVNVRKLFSLAVDQDTLTCIHGLRVLSFCWVLLGHRFVSNVLSPNMNSLQIFEWQKQWWNVIIMAGGMAVDTFFTISGLLVTLNVPLAALILGYISILKHFTNGPLWPIIVAKMSTCCYMTGWATFFHLSNFINIYFQCIEQAWYLAVDTQLYLTAPLFLYNLPKYHNWCIFGATVSCVASMVYTFQTTITHNYGATFFEGDRSYFENIYTRTWVRMPPWMIGLVFGYYLFQVRNRTTAFRMGKTLNIFLWLVTFVILLGVVGSHLLFCTTNGYNAFHSALYNSLARPLWALAICYIILACSTGHGGPINAILSASVFRPFSKLTYCMFLIHLGVLSVLRESHKATTYFGNMKTFHDFCGDFVATALVSSIFSLIFESPVIALGKILFNRGLQKNNTNESSIQQKSQIQLTDEAPVKEKNNPPFNFWIQSIIGAKPMSEKSTKTD